MRRLLPGLLAAALSCSGVEPTPNTPTPVTPEEDAGTEVVCVPLQGSLSAITAGLYCVTGDVIIPTGVTLDIPPGTTFIVKGRYRFGRDVATADLEPPAIEGSGSIRAIGTADMPIIFRGETRDTAWYGLTISHAHDVVHLEYVTISDTYKDDRDQFSRVWRRGGALNSYMNKKGTILRNCTFTNNRAYSVGGAVEIFGHGSWPTAGPVELTGNRFEDNSCECGAYSVSSTDLCGGGAVRLTQVSGNADLVKIEGNLFKRNQARQTTAVEAFGGAISGAHSGVILGPGNVFEANVAGSGDGAISCNHQPVPGAVIDEVDPTVVFSANTPDNGCGR